MNIGYILFTCLRSLFMIDPKPDYSNYTPSPEMLQRHAKWEELRHHNSEVSNRIIQKYLADPEGYSKLKGWDK